MLKGALWRAGATRRLAMEGGKAGYDDYDMEISMLVIGTEQHSVWRLGNHRENANTSGRARLMERLVFRPRGLTSGCTGP